MDILISHCVYAQVVRREVYALLELISMQSVSGDLADLKLECFYFIKGFCPAPEIPHFEN